VSKAVGGAGATGNGAGLAGGAGGVATASGANGGAGASTSLTNTAVGSTAGGSLVLKQTAIGGRGGTSAGGIAGKGGAATSSLSFNDTGSFTRSAKVTASSIADGGAGGTASAGSRSAAGGAATASLNLTGAAVVEATSSAVGGAGATIAGLSTATTVATGVSGSLAASAATSLRVGQLIHTVTASAKGTVAGTSTAKAIAGIGGPAPGFTTGPQAVALETGSPGAVSTSAVLSKNGNIATAFGASPVFFAIDELGGRHSSAAAGAQTTTSEIDETVNLTKLASRQDLVVGLYNGVAVGSNVTGVTFDLFADGVDVIHKSFASGAAAQTYFTNNAVDVGSLASGPLSGNTLTLKAVLRVTSSAAGSGFYGEIIVGDPPQAAASGAHLGLIQAMAGFGAKAPAASSAVRETAWSSHSMLSAPRSHMAAA
jgi:hypothetical protein